MTETAYTGDWSLMTEEEKYAEWSRYVTTGVIGGNLQDYSDYCDWMDEWEASHV